MHAIGRQRGFKWLFAAMISLVVTLGSVVGMAAHATGQHHKGQHGPAISVAVNGHQTHDQSHQHAHAGHGYGHAHAHGAQQPIGDHQVPPLADHRTFDGGHTFCGDLFCHCGWTFGDARGVIANLSVEALLFVLSDEAGAEAGGTFFDRPPKSLVRT
jgi:hypothetical protein